MPIHHKSVFDDLPARLKLDVNPYVHELIAAQAGKTLPLLYGPELRELRGQWRERIAGARAPFIPTEPSGDPLLPGAAPGQDDGEGDRRAPAARLILEIGMHKGRCLTSMAAAHPRDAFVGMDITFKRVVTTARRTSERRLTNAWAVLGDARHLASLFAPGELSGVILFFPDPWIKKENQAHRRLLNEDFCRLLAEMIDEAAGFVWLKTDSQVYFAEAATHLATAGFTEFAGESLDLYREGYESVFEAMFAAQKKPVFQALWCHARQRATR